MKDLTRKLGQDMSSAQARDCRGSYFGPFIWGSAEQIIQDELVKTYTFIIQVGESRRFNVSWQVIK